MAILYSLIRGIPKQPEDRPIIRVIRPFAVISNNEKGRPTGGSLLYSV